MAYIPVFSVFNLLSRKVRFENFIHGFEHVVRAFTVQFLYFFDKLGDVLVMERNLQIFAKTIEFFPPDSATSK